MGPVCKALPNQPLIHHCCRWEKEADKPAKLSHLCCPDDECGDPHEYDQLTCTLPQVSLTDKQKFAHMLIDYHFACWSTKIA